MRKQVQMSFPEPHICGSSKYLDAKMPGELLAGSQLFASLYDSDGLNYGASSRVNAHKEVVGLMTSGTAYYDLSVICFFLGGSESASYVRICKWDYDSS